MIADYDQYTLSTRESIRYYAGIILVTGVLLYLFYDSLLVSILVSPAAGFFFKKRYSTYLNRMRREGLRNQFVELLQSLSASMSSGRQMAEALEEGFCTLSTSYPLDAPLVMELSYINKCIRESQEGEETLLRSLADRSKIVDISNFVDVYSICRETGGDMEKAIGKTSQLILGKLSIEKEMKVLSAQKKFEGKIISLMPVFVVLFLRITSPGYVEPLYATLAGRMVMTCSLAAIGYAYYLTDKISGVSL